MLADYLDGLEARRPQTVGNMTVIPLVNQQNLVNVGLMTDIYLEADHSYTCLELGNASDKPTIIPSGYTMLTKEHAQDRTVGSKHILGAGKSKRLGAFCVQSSQPGLMKKTNKDQRDVRLLPWSIRLQAYQNRKSSSVGQLWDSLQRYNGQAGVPGNYLVHLFDKLKEQLAEFVAEFELIPQQRGAIVLINHQVVAIEITASPEAFAAQWETLIRDCYGTEALMQQSGFKTVDESAVFGDPETLDDLMAALDKCEQAENEFTQRTVQALLMQMEQRVPAEKEKDLTLYDLETPEYLGQAIMKSGCESTSRQGVAVVQEQIVDLTLMRKGTGGKGFRFQMN